MARATKRKLNKMWLDDVPADKVFLCRDGRVVNSMGELAAVLKEMSDDTFHYHVSNEKNDFSTWIRDVIGDVTLAKDLAKTMRRTSTLHKVEMRLRSIQASS